MKTLLAILLFAIPAAAQDTVIVGQPLVIEWDQDAPNLAEAQAYSYRLNITPADDQVLSSVTCIATAVPTTFTCSAPMLALTVGTFTMDMQATYNGLTSVNSTPYTLNVVAAPTAPKPPRNPRARQK